LAKDKILMLPTYPRVAPPLGACVCQKKYIPLTYCKRYVMRKLRHVFLLQSMSRPPKHSVVSAQIASEIIAGKYRQAGRLPSEASFVKRFGVSRPTIGRALKDLQDKGLIEPRRGPGTYVRSETESRSAAQPNPELGLIVPKMVHTEIFEHLCGDLASLARMNDCAFLWGASVSSFSESNGTLEEAEALCARYVERKIGGVFFVPFEHQADCEDANLRITDRLKQAGIPVVLLDHDIGPFPSRSGYDVVGIDNFAGGYLLADHLIKLGARRLAYVMRPLTASTVDARIAGARMAILAHGLAIPNPFVFVGEPTDIKFVRSFGQSQQFDALLCASDHIAAQVSQNFSRLGIRVPQDMRLAGFDNVRFASLLTIPLTTVEQPCHEIAVTAFNALRERIKNPALPARTLVLTPRLIVRETCGANLRQPEEQLSHDNPQSTNVPNPV
jgi:LacI family transcriptional regulator